jgi:probable HAF family extracellular repeat protein
MKSKLLGAVAAFAMIGIVSSAYSEDYTITDLGTLGGTSSFTAGINSLGEVTGSSFDSNNNQYAFLYDGTTMRNLGTLSAPPSFGTGINARGEVTGAAINSAGLQHAFLYNGKTMLDLGVLPGPYQQIGNSIGEAINTSGEVAGTSAASSGTPHAFLYNGKTMLDLGTFGGTNSVGLGINDSGEVTGAALTTGNATYYAFLYNEKTMLNLGTLGGAYSVGEAINDEGEVVGDTNIAGKGTAFLYENGVMFNLNSLISPTDPLYGDVWLNEATGINDRGQIVADGWYTDGQSGAFLLTPCPGCQISATLSLAATLSTSAPEPSTWALMLLGFAGLGFAGYRRARAAQATVF